jgi:hypothetical protein
VVQEGGAQRGEGVRLDLEHLGRCALLEDPGEVGIEGLDAAGAGAVPLGRCKLGAGPQYPVDAALP